MCIYTIGLPCEFSIKQEMGHYRPPSLNTAASLSVVYTLGHFLLEYGNLLLESRESNGNPHLTDDGTLSQEEEAASSRPQGQRNGRAF